MTNIGIIGSTSFLGSYMQDRLDAIAIYGRFGWSKAEWLDYAKNQPHLDTIIILARACRKEKPRRDIFTITEEVAGLANILSVFHDRRIIYSSSRAVFNDSINDYAPITREDITKMTEVACRGHLRNMTINLPAEVKLNTTVTSNAPAIDEYSIYSATKLCGESLVRCCKDYTIFRIWDIVE
jgi:nucleoside-diphosphate-sugar epimerase